jgi:hypothetical protein
MKHTARVITAGRVGGALIAFAATAFAIGRKQYEASSASSSPAAKASVSPEAKAERAFPFHGMISAVDTKAKTFTIAGKEKSRVFQITNKTVLTKADNPAKMKDVVEKEETRGSYWKRADGSFEAKNVKLGPLTEQEKAAEEARKARHAERRAAKEAATAPSASSAAAASASPSSP